jgi:hypothetical protein
MTPVRLKDSGPLVQRPDGIRVRAVEHLPAVAAGRHEADVAQHLEVLRHGRLTQREVADDVADVTLLPSEIDQDVAALRLSDRVEDVGGRRGTRPDRVREASLTRLAPPPR